jgi:voltage-gated potassium channel
VNLARTSLRRPRWRRARERDPFERVRLGVFALTLVVAFGTSGYIVLGLSVFDSLYQTIITISTVGYQEVGASQQITQSYRAFTLVLVVLGTGTALYTFGVLIDSLIEGSLNDELRRRRMLREIENYESHVIIAGWGRMGHAIADAVTRAGLEIVVIDRAPDDDISAHAVVIGEATDDGVLRQAGIERSATLIAALSNDADNLFVTLSARSIRPDLFIVARTSDQKNEPKFFQAGADRVVNPHEIGGSRMAALALQPHVAEFLDEVLHDESHDVAVHEVIVGASSAMVGRPLVDLHTDSGRPLIIAIRGQNGRYHTNPVPETPLVGDQVIIALGSADELRSLRHQLA